MTQSSETTILEKPGAGLPRMERFFLSFGFKLIRSLKGRIALNDLFHKELTTLLELESSIPDKKGNQPVLVKRLKGMEDSSRNWSAYMVFEHLHMVNVGILQIIKTLLKNKQFTQEIKIENVKPNPHSDISSVERFSDSAQTFLGTMQTLESLKTKTTHKHPWFGELDAHSWHTLATIHMQLHRRQLELIIAKL